MMKKKSRTNHVVHNVGSGLVYKIISIVLPFILRTVMINMMGMQYAGLNTLFSSILQVLNMTELGFGSALVFSMYKPIAENDEKKICELLNFYRTVYRIIGSVTLILGVLVAPWLKYLISGTYPNDINIYILYFVYLFNTSISYFMFAYKQALLNAYQRNDVVNTIMSITYFVTYIAQILAIVITKNYYVYIIFTPICTFSINILAAIFSKKMFPKIFCKGSLPTVEKNDIFKRTRALIGHKVGGVLINSLDSIVVSAFLGLTTVAIYGNYFYILTAINGIIDIGYQAILASVGNSIVTENRKKVYSLFEELTLLLEWVMCNCCCCLICLFQPFIILWLGKKGLFPAATMVIVVIYFYANKARLIGLNFKEAAGLWQNDFWKPYIGLVVNLTTNIILVNIIGVNGVFLSTIFTMALIYFPWETYVVFKYMFKTKPVKYLTHFFYYALITVAACAIGYIVTTNIKLNGVGGIVVKGIIAVFVANVLFISFNINNPELKSVCKRFLKTSH